MWEGLTPFPLFQVVDSSLDNSIMSKHYIFVYGTLKTGEFNWDRLKRQGHQLGTSIGYGRTVKPYPLVLATKFLAPFLLDVPGVGKVSRPGVGLLRQFSPFRYFPHFPLLSKQMLAIEYHVCIWQVSPQLSCGDTCQIWMWLRESNRYFCKIENFAYGEISERSFSNPHPRCLGF